MRRASGRILANLDLRQAYASSIENQGHMRRRGDERRNKQKQVYAGAYGVYIYIYILELAYRFKAIS